MPAQSKSPAPVGQPTQAQQQTAANNEDAKHAAELAELEALKAQNARLVREAEEAKEAAAQAEMQAKTAREEADAAKALLQKQEAEAEAEAARQEALITRQINAQRRVRIVIPSGRDPSERAPVMVAVNGRPFLIVRDREVDVPQAVLNVLDLAREQVAEMEDVNGQIRNTFRETQRFNYTIKGYVDPKTGQLEAR